MMHLILKLVVLLNEFSHAGGSIQLHGNLLNCDTSFCSIKVEEQVYKLELKKIESAQKSFLLSKKKEDLIDMTVSMKAIKEVVDYRK